MKRQKHRHTSKLQDDADEKTLAETWANVRSLQKEIAELNRDTERAARRRQLATTEWQKERAKRRRGPSPRPPPSPGTPDYILKAV